ncbi:MAG: lytic murein transglycosylase [Alphaproteobacteria bacterium]|nr:lytic murein transglycosylase [Alphaproteobacteria bacterium]
MSSLIILSPGDAPQFSSRKKWSPFILLKYCLTLGLFWVLFNNPNTAIAAEPFAQWLSGIRAEARAQGISEQTLSQALNGIAPIPRIIELDRKQPEGRMSFQQYYNRVISPQRIEKGREMLRLHNAALQKISAAYGVPPQYIVALWGIETSYGDNTGGFMVVPALATLAYDGRRSAFFRKELLSALKIIDAGHINASDMKGSWAGAMGQNQFMPSSFHAFAVDGNGDGRRDIWTTLPDVFASTANYLSKSGWKEEERWGRKVTLPQGFPKSLTGLETRKTLAQWKGMGVKSADGTPLPETQEPMTVSIVTPDGTNGPAYLVYGNYRVIMKWNKSTYFATSVGLLADSIAR